MRFLEKAEHFVSQLQYSLAIEPEPIIDFDGIQYNLALPPHVFIEIANKFKIDYPFNYQNKIIELKILKRKEEITEKEASDMILNYVNSYSINLLPPMPFSQQLFLLSKVKEISSEKISKPEKSIKFKKIKQDFDNEYKEEQVSALDFLQNSDLLYLINDFQLHIEGKKNIILKELVEAMKDNQQSETSLAPEPPTVKENNIAIFSSHITLPKQPDNARVLKQNLFVDYFYHPKKDILVQLLKEEFINEKGKTIKMLIEILKEEKVLALESGEFSRFYISMKEYFGTNVGTYQGINDFEIKSAKNKKDYEVVKIRVDSLLKKIA